MNHEITTQPLIQRIRQIWESARFEAARSVNSSHVCANWLIGQQIVEAEQGGVDRAEYGTALLKNLSQQLSIDYGNGFSVSALQYMRSFYLNYPQLIQIDQTAHESANNSSPTTVMTIQHALRVISTLPSSQSWKPGLLHSGLSWTHYRALLKVERMEVRNFYEIETVKNGWSARQLERQINSLLFDRLLKSRDKEGVVALANEGLVVNKPIDALKNPYVLEFLDLPESHRLVE
jgi:DUF1016 N-terminal domain